MRLVGPTDTQRETVIKGAQTGRETTYGRIAEVSNPQHVKALRQAGYTLGTLGGVDSSRGRVCGSCGFHAYFTACSRCGGECS